MKRYVLLTLLALLISSITNAQQIDCVHLKNGSILKGIIIEQIIGESIKVQTDDGSIFVYKMSEVLKISKENSKREVCRLKEKNGEPGKLREESVSRRRKDLTGAAPKK